MSYYEVRAYPFTEGSSSASRLAWSAYKLGYRGLVLISPPGGKIWGMEAARRVKGMDLVVGVEIATSNLRALHSRISSSRSRVPFLLVRGGPESVNRQASEDPRVDVLMAPEDSRISIPVARSAETNQVAIGLDMRPMIRSRGAFRSRWMENFRHNLDISRKFDLKMVLTASPRSHLDLRGPRELKALAVVAGMEPWEAEEALMHAEKLIKMNRRHWAGPEVEVL